MRQIGGVSPVGGRQGSPLAIGASEVKPARKVLLVEGGTGGDPNSAAHERLLSTVRIYLSARGGQEAVAELLVFETDASANSATQALRLNSLHEAHVVTRVSCRACAVGVNHRRAT
jgi:hypothetical protein